MTKYSVSHIIQLVHTHWFESTDMEKWFGGKVDKEICDKFLKYLKFTECTKTTLWTHRAKKVDYNGTLALVVMLDQFSRNCYRGSMSMYKNDELALSVLLDFLKEGMPKICKFFSDEQIMFLLMPLQHTTHLIFQHLGIITLFEVLKIRKQKCASLVHEYLMQPYDMKRLKDIQVSLKACSEILAIALFHQIGHCIVLTTFGGFPKRHSREFVQKIWDRAGIEHLRTKNPY